jgi:hypothetical protein
MKRIRNLWNRRGGLDAELRELRPEPREQLVHELVARIEGAGRPARPRRVFRVALAGAVAASLLVPMAALGGFGHVASVASDAADAVGSLIASHGDETIDVGGLSPGGDQYQAGFAWGDPAHNHDGAPGLLREGGDLAPPLVARCVDGTARVTTRIVLDEQALLRVSVRTASGKKLLLDHARGDAGEPAKTLVYRILVPRTFRLALRIPCDVLESGRTYRLAINATDPDGNESTLLVPFRALTATT